MRRTIDGVQREHFVLVVHVLAVDVIGLALIEPARIRATNDARLCRKAKRDDKKAPKWEKEGGDLF